MGGFTSRVCFCKAVGLLLLNIRQYIAGVALSMVIQSDCLIWLKQQNLFFRPITNEALVFIAKVLLAINSDFFRDYA